MEVQTYLINGRFFTAHDPSLQEALARVYGTPVRPRCMCVRGGIEMYVSKFHEFVIKRMPETGSDHRPTCPSYELSASESGLGEVLGEAIIERGPRGVELRLDFPLTRRIGRSFATADSKPSGEVTVARKQLSLRGLLHYLWERAGTSKFSKNGHGIYLSNHRAFVESAVHFRAPLMDRMNVECPFVSSSANTIPRGDANRSTRHLAEY